MRGSWNHNSYYHRALLRRLPPQIGRALDVGCGDGSFARLLATRARQVDAIDVDPQELRRARTSAEGGNNIRCKCADLLTYEPGDGTYDVVTALAVVHHMPFEPALMKLQRLLTPGGRLLVLGLWPPTATAPDVAVSAVATVVTNARRLASGPTAMSSPTREPEMPLHEVRRRATVTLPGATVTRRLLWRYILDWTKPINPTGRALR